MILSEPASIIFIFFPERVWYSAITCLHAPHGVAGMLQSSPSLDAAIAIASIAASGYLELA